MGHWDPPHGTAVMKNLHQLIMQGGRHQKTIDQHFSLILVH